MKNSNIHSCITNQNEGASLQRLSKSQAYQAKADRPTVGNDDSISQLTASRDYILKHRPAFWLGTL